MTRHAHKAANPRPAGRSRRAGALFKLGALAGSVVVAALLGELAVRVAKPGFPGFRVPQVGHRTVTGLGFEMVPNQEAYSTASRVHINADGFRGPEVRPLEAAGQPRVIALGDSMTFGVAVEEHETYARQLQRLLASQPGARDPEVINTGVQRYFTFQEIDLLKARVEGWRPDAVTLAVYINDLAVRPGADYVREYENEREQAATSFRNRLPFAYLAIKNSALIELAKNTYLALRESRRPTPSLLENALSGRIGERDEPKWQGVEQEFETFAALARTHGFKPVVLFVPVRAQVQGDFPDSLYPRRLAARARELGLPAIDLTDAFRRSLREGEDPYLPWDDHMSVAGHRLTAEALLAELARDGFGEADPEAAAAAPNGR